MANRRPPNSSGFQQPRNDTSGRHPVYRGIRLRAGKWVSEIREPNQTKRIWLGTYATPEMAAAAYDVAALALKGRNVLLNFPDSVISSTLPECPTADDIRAAAARAAAARAPGYGYETGGGSITSTAPTGAYMGDEHEPNLWSDMAEGMLISPPRMDSSPPDDGTDHSGGGNLWNY
ncbi:unnamed protein product [Lactuca saligna]|uniref:AP2/ERF domain-containing protein n=1 Tax=Lactuca saligna TaxID=75948 RepID=A0AA35YG58_LACSI|nr:unnamed protein product [Lactuca saligna]